MPTLDKEFLYLLQDDYTKYNVFIETGTYNGSTIFSMEPLFTTLHTIEISEKYYKNTKKRYNGDKINFLLGDSSTVLQYILPTITEKCIIFLDGHWSGDDTGQGDKDCPLIEEVTLINKLCKTESIIIIDDCRLFGKGPNNGYNEDWSDINTTKLVGILQGRISKTYYLDTETNKDDRLIIHINAIKSVEEDKEKAYKQLVEDAKLVAAKEIADAKETAIIEYIKAKAIAERIEIEKLKADEEARIEKADEEKRIEIEKLKADEETRIEIEKLKADEEKRIEKADEEKRIEIEKLKSDEETRISVAVEKAVAVAIEKLKSVAKVDINTEIEEKQISRAVANSVSNSKDTDSEELRISKAVNIAVSKSMKTQQECCIIS